MNTFGYEELIQLSAVDIEMGVWHQVAALCDLIERLDDQGRGESDYQRFLAYCIECAEASGQDLKGMIEAYRFGVEIGAKNRLHVRIFEELPLNLAVFALSNVCLKALNASRIQEDMHIMRVAISLVQNWCSCGELVDKMLFLSKLFADRADCSSNHKSSSSFLMLSFLVYLAWLCGNIGTEAYRESIAAHDFTGKNDCIYRDYGSRFEFYCAAKCMEHATAFIEQEKVSSIIRQSVNLYAAHGKKSFDMLCETNQRLEETSGMHHESV